MRLLLVDDEPPALAKLRRLLTDLPGVEIAGEAADGESALAQLEACRTDAVLLDIQMPGMSGLEVATMLPAGVEVVFVTAYDAHAVQAFELNAVDYLLKPYTQERLAAAIARLRLRLADTGQRRQGLLKALHQLQPVAGHWMVPAATGLCRIPLAQVECVEAADNYIELHVAGRSHLDRITLSDFLAHPAARGFVRVHRRYAVQPAHIRAVRPRARGDAELELGSGRRVRVSRRYRERLLGAQG